MLLPLRRGSLERGLPQLHAPLSGQRVIDGHADFGDVIADCCAVCFEQVALENGARSVEQRDQVIVRHSPYPWGGAWAARIRLFAGAAYHILYLENITSYDMWCGPCRYHLCFNYLVRVVRASW